MLENRKFDWKLIIVTTFGFLAYMIGAGTASGQELMQYAVSFGYKGIPFNIVAFIFFVWSSYLMIDLGRQQHVETTNEAYEYLLGKTVGKICDYITILICFLIFVVMLAGAGSTLTQYFGISDVMGRLIMTGVVLATALLGLEKFLKILSAVAPVIIIFSVLIACVSIVRDWGNFLTAGALVEELQIPHLNGVNTWWHSALLYPMGGVILSMPFFTKMGGRLGTRKNVVASSFGYSILFSLIATCFYLAMFLNVGQVHDKAIPMLEIAGSISPVIGFVFMVIIAMGIYSTAVPLCWVVADRLSKNNKVVYRILTVAICVIGFYGALFPFDAIINIVYPYLATAGTLIFAIMLFRYYHRRRKLRTIKEVETPGT